jgi:hypothetical protein
VGGEVKKIIITDPNNIESQIEEILNVMKNDNNRPRGAVNWADLHVHAVDECKSIYPDDSEHYYSVLIEECEPYSSIIATIHEAIETDLDIRIITEW